MSETLTFAAYCKRLWDEYLHGAKPWARDQIGWPLLVLILSPIIAAQLLHRAIDGPLFWTSVLFYLIALAVFGLTHFIRSGWQAYQDKERLISSKDKDIEKLTNKIGYEVRGIGINMPDASLEACLLERRSKERKRLRTESKDPRDASLYHAEARHSPQAMRPTVCRRARRLNLRRTP